MKTISNMTTDSLVDASLVPLQKAYLLLWVMIFLILAGNTAFPVCLRFCLWVSLHDIDFDFVLPFNGRWTASKCVPRSSDTYATLRFILDHPRRCFLCACIRSLLFLSTS